MPASFKKLKPNEAAELGTGNRAGWLDYIKGRPAAIKKDEAESHYDRGYLAGYRLAARGRRPLLMGVNV